MPNAKKIEIQIPDFRTTPAAALSAEVDRASQGYTDAVNAVLTQVQDGGLSEEGMLYAIVLLGQLRAATAASTLVEHIDFKPARKDTSGGIGRWGPYPAQQALVKIGLPAVNVVLDQLPAEGRELQRELLYAVLTDALGKKVADAMVRVRFEEEQNPARRANLQAVIQLAMRQ
jgi:hypothetical protein